MEHLWTYTSIILAIVVLAKLLSTKTNSVDVLWLIVFGAVGVNIGILPEHNEILESIGECGIVFIMFALGFEKNVANFVQGLKRVWVSQLSVQFFHLSQDTILRYSLGMTGMLR